VNLNLKYAEQRDVIRLLGEPFDTDPEKFKDGYDVSVSAGLGLGSAEQNMRGMEVVGTFFTELIPLMSLFMANPVLFEKFRSQKAKMLEEMGIKDIDTYLPTKDEMFPQHKQQGQNGPPQPPIGPNGQPQLPPQGMM